VKTFRLVSLFLLGILIAPLQAFAQTEILPAGPIGTPGLDVEGTGTGILSDTANTIINALTLFAGFAAVLYMIYAGFLFLTAGLDENRAKTGRQGVINAIIGILIIISTYTLINFTVQGGSLASSLGSSITLRRYDAGDNSDLNAVQANSTTSNRGATLRATPKPAASGPAIDARCTQAISGSSYCLTDFKDLFGNAKYCARDTAGAVNTANCLTGAEYNVLKACLGRLFAPINGDITKTPKQKEEAMFSEGPGFLQQCRNEIFASEPSAGTELRFSIIDSDALQEGYSDDLSFDPSKYKLDILYRAVDKEDLRVLTGSPAVGVNKYCRVHPTSDRPNIGACITYGQAIEYYACLGGATNVDSAVGCKVKLGIATNSLAGSSGMCVRIDSNVYYDDCARMASGKCKVCASINNCYDCTSTTYKDGAICRGIRESTKSSC
jgi:hypothetical protein